VQVSTTSFPSTGAGLELSYAANLAYVQSFNRTGSAYTALSLIGNTISIAPSGNNVGVFSSTGLAVTGALSTTGTVTVGSGTSVGLTGINIANGASNYSFYTASDNTKQFLAGIDHTLSFGKMGMLSSHDLAIVTGNATRILVDTSGNVGIGTSSPAYKLDVSGTLNAGGLISANGGSGGFPSLTTAYQLSVGTDIVLGSGYGIIVNGSRLFAFNSTGLAVTGQIAATTTAGQHTFNVTQSITTGYAGINILRAGTGQQAIRFAQATDGNEVGSVTVSTTATTYNTSSDYRLKNITGPLTDSGAFIDALKPKVGTWKSDGSKFAGFVAHEFAEICPSAVTGEKDELDKDGNPKYQAMQAGTAEVIANLVAELQSLRRRNADIESRLATLETR
jgi:hypothetical protein